MTPEEKARKGKAFDIWCKLSQLLIKTEPGIWGKEVPGATETIDKGLREWHKEQWVSGKAHANSLREGQDRAFARIEAVVKKSRDEVIKIITPYVSITDSWVIAMPENSKDDKARAIGWGATLKEALEKAEEEG